MERAVVIAKDHEANWGGVYLDGILMGEGHLDDVMENVLTRVLSKICDRFEEVEIDVVKDGSCPTYEEGLKRV